MLGFQAPLVDALASGRAVPLPAGAVRDGLVVAGGVAGLILGSGALVAGMAAAAPLLAFEVPLAVRLLWGGIGEELLMRWGVMTTIGWGLWRLCGRPARLPAALMWVAIGIAALLFAGGHLPALLLVPEPPATRVLLVVAGNLLPGLLFGWLFARHGIETAMLAHGGAHPVAVMAGGAPG